ncbi:MAG: formylglycine-generating enzyme family protein, partial [Planctomycetaceae bacterium]|nr:formylglycine-generating enzyme family protein [Planctomycetaceae bacterium]
MISFSKKSKTLSANNNANKSICAALHAADTAPANTISVSVQNGEIVCNSSVTNGSIPKPGGDVHTNNTAFRLDHFENLYFHPQLPADATNVQVAVSLTDKTDSLKLRWNNAVLPSAAAGQRIDIPQDKVKTEGNVLRITATGNTLSVESVTFYFAVPYLVGELLELVIENMKYRFHYCPAGAFTMGSPLSEAERRENEQLHPVTLSQGFWMGETEVTQEQWESIMGNNPSHFKGEKLPVECVSWNACQEFVNKLNALGAAPKGYKFSLPTEAQWEYACRSGTSGAYAGDLDKMAWYEDNSGEKTHEVGTKQA